MSRPDAFALQNSGYNAFLYAEVGTELNGSQLTVLSLLARLGRDPWAEAAQWARLPRAAIIDRLAESIALMPMCQQALAEARETAARLILLLPSQARQAAPGPAAKTGLSDRRRWLPVTIFYCNLALGMAANLMAPQRPAGSAAAPAAQTTSQAR